MAFFTDFEFKQFHLDTFPVVRTYILAKCGDLKLAEDLAQEGFIRYFYFNPRPSQMDSRIKTTTGLPNFPSYTSGHSTFSGAAATILGHIIPARATAYTAMAREASESRIYGASHYRSDCVKGLEAGNKVGDYAIARARTDGAE